jgi:hypothetical protein
MIEHRRPWRVLVLEEPRMRQAVTVSVTEEERAALEAIARGRRSEVRHATRVKMVLLAADGLENVEIGKRLGVSRVTALRHLRPAADLPRKLQKSEESIVGFVVRLDLLPLLGRRRRRFRQCSATASTSDAAPSGREIV